MNKRDYLAILIAGLLLTIVIIMSSGSFSSNVKNIELTNETKQFLETTVDSKLDAQYEELENFTDAWFKQINKSNGKNEERDKALYGFIEAWYKQANKSNAKNEIRDALMAENLNVSLTSLGYILKAMEQNVNITEQNYNISKEHKIVAAEHDKIQNIQNNTTNVINNQTNATYNMLHKFGTENQGIGLNNLKLNNDTNQVVHDLNHTMTIIGKYLTNASEIEYLEDED